LALEAILSMIGDGARALVARALGSGEASERAIEQAALLERTVPLFLKHYMERPVVHTKLLPGVREVLALGLPSAVVTNKPRAISLLVLEQLGIDGSFSAVFAGGDGPLKPSPHGVLQVTQELGARIDHVWMIGDGPQDVLAGRAAGCFTIAVPGIADRERVLAAEPHLVVESLLEVVKLVGGDRGRITSA
jgi:phosphoglycolate phosphatase